MDPSNELIKEGPIQKISTRNNSTSEKYLFLVGEGSPGQGRGAEEVGVGRGAAQPGQGVPGSPGHAGDELRADPAPCVGHGWEFADPWAWQPWEMFDLCRVGGGWGRNSHSLGGILPKNQLSPGQ